MTRTHVPLVHKKREPKPKSRLTRGGRIKPVSATRAKINKIYSALRLRFLEENPYCMWWMLENGVSRSFINRLGVCTFPPNMMLQVAPRSTEVHHRKGRGKHLLDVSTWLAVSHEGHQAIHADPKAAYEKGYMLPRN